ncbi:hypothetical protein Goari_020119 [Gossypium aridum]|uniref:RNase H type-1 domain-containing protein n=1 Tax=Gossypium aridum TaxID=34290 RepID=A0A7J8WUS1_GOSAI|nr:hypothetical protein [Gossypium aridum]
MGSLPNLAVSVQLLAKIKPKHYEFSHGNWILGFNHYLGRCTVFEAELCGILDYILMLLSRSFKRATIQTNNLEVIIVLQDNAMIDLGITVLRRVQRIMRAERTMVD